MANRYKSEDIGAMYARLVVVGGTVRVGAAGAVTSGIDGYSNAAGNALRLPKGIASVTRVDVGEYVIALGLPNTQPGTSGVDSYFDLLSCQVTPVCPTLAAVFAQVVTTNLAAGSGSPGSITQSLSTITIQFVNGSGARVDLPTDGAMALMIVLQNSQVV